MDINVKVFASTLGIATLLLVGWVIYLLNSNKTISTELEEIQENFHALQGFNEVVKYDLEISQDSLRVVTDLLRNCLDEETEQNENK